ncbi:hypothetical protein BT67DRAFT_35041, partial [Trichocladium antarcticum]
MESLGKDDVLDQVINITRAGGTVMQYTVSMIDHLYIYQAASCISFGAQFGASVMMLVVLLCMTPGPRFKRATTLINMAALTVNAVHKLFLALFFTTAFPGFYSLLTFDTQYVPQKDINTSVVGNIFSIPVTALIEAALIVQAWAMMRIWPTLWKTVATVVSLGLVLTTVAFNIGSNIVQTQYILQMSPDRFEQLQNKMWLRRGYLGLITASICWFCFLFNIRLVMHMWTNRTILPTLKGLKAMDVLVITNGFLMFIPG